MPEKDKPTNELDTRAKYDFLYLQMERYEIRKNLVDKAFLITELKKLNEI